MDRSRRFFKAASVHYQDLIRTRDSVEWMKSIVEPRMGEKVLDMGNGGVREFFSDRTSLYVGFDFSVEMLRKGRGADVLKVCGKVEQPAFREGSFDTLFFRSLLHHLAQKKMEATVRRVKEVLLKGGSCLKREGSVIIVEPCLPAFLEKLERIVFPFLRFFFFLTGQSVVFLFSEETLTRTMRESGYREIKAWRTRRQEGRGREWVAPMIGLPFFKIPRWLNPAWKIVLVAEKGRGESDREKIS